MKARIYRDRCLARVKPLCADAIKIMRDALDDAERSVNTAGTPEEAISRVLHRCAWGWANASGSLTTALSALEDTRRSSEIEGATYD